ncbi:hypothetical protein, partial [Streptomyces botrytidirepellens]
VPGRSPRDTEALPCPVGLHEEQHMRNVITTNATPEVREEYAEQIELLLTKTNPLRETTQANKAGQIDFWVRLYSYPAPGTGVKTWAVDYHDPASRELEESTSHEEADERYEEHVRAAAKILEFDHDGKQIPFTSTDVEGVPGPHSD